MGVAGHAQTDYRIVPKISKSLSLGIIWVPIKFGSISLKNGEVIQVLGVGSSFWATLYIHDWQKIRRSNLQSRRKSPTQEVNYIPAIVCPLFYTH